MSFFGAVKHALNWLTSPTNDMIAINPNFVPRYVGDEGISIYCIHGTADYANSFQHIAEGIAPTLPSCISNIKLLSFTGRFRGHGIEFFVHQLVEKIFAYKDKEIIFMGHSRGGVISAYFNEYLARITKIKVHGVICLATPLKGSDIASGPMSWISTSMVQMQKDSPFLKHLENKIIKSKTKYFAFEAEKDMCVLTDNGSIKNHLEPIKIAKHGHLSMMSISKKVYWKVSECLDEICGPELPKNLEEENNEINSECKM